MNQAGNPVCSALEKARKKDETDIYTERYDVSDEHPLRCLRVNTVVQQFDDFLDTYGVREGDLMYLAPEDRIDLWTGSDAN